MYISDLGFSFQGSMYSCIILLYCLFLFQLAAGLLGVSKEDLLNANTALDPNKCRTAMLILMSKALCGKGGGDIDLSEAGQQVRVPFISAC